MIAKRSGEMLLLHDFVQRLDVRFHFGFTFLLRRRHGVCSTSCFGGNSGCTFLVLFVFLRGCRFHLSKCFLNFRFDILVQRQVSTVGCLGKVAQSICNPTRRGLKFIHPQFVGIFLTFLLHGSPREAASCSFESGHTKLQMFKHFLFDAFKSSLSTALLIRWLQLSIFELFQVSPEALLFYEVA